MSSADLITTERTHARHEIPSSDADARHAIHALAAADVYATLATQPQGLTQDEARGRKRRFGPNVIHEANGTPLVRRLLANFTHLMAILLWLGGLIAFLANMPQLGFAIWLVVLINGVFSPRHKGKVEAGIKCVKNNGLKGRRFASIEEENRHLATWEATVADTRIHGTTRRQVGKVFAEATRRDFVPKQNGLDGRDHRGPSGLASAQVRISLVGLLASRARLRFSGLIQRNLRSARSPVSSPGEHTMNDRLLSTLRQLRLSGLAQSLDIRLQEAATHQLNHAEFLELILQDELLVRQERPIGRRVKAAMFRELKPLADFDWSFNPSIPKKQIFDLVRCQT